MKFIRSGDYLTDVMKAAGLTQRDVARKIKVHGQFISNCSRGLCLIPAKYFKKLNKAMPGFKIAYYIEQAALDAYDNMEAKLKKKT